MAEAPTTCRSGMEHAKPCGPVVCPVDQVPGCAKHGADEYCACGCSADETWCMADPDEP